MKSLKLVVAGVLVLGACAGDTAADVEGTYTVATTNRDDACNLGWVVGQTNSGIMVVITQNGGSAVAEVKGLAVVGLDAVIGTSTFSGSVSGDAVDLFAAGTKSKMTGNCTYTMDGRINATLTGDALQGTIRYIANTNTASDCAAVKCTSQQDFSGSRPPK
jgi:hypothetical protein